MGENRGYLRVTIIQYSGPQKEKKEKKLQMGYVIISQGEM